MSICLVYVSDNRSDYVLLHCARALSNKQFVFTDVTVFSASKLRCLWNLNMHGMMVNDGIYEIKYQIFATIEE